MIKVGLIGFGAMGRQVLERVEEAYDMECVGIVSSSAWGTALSLEEQGELMDVVVDFSHPDNLEMIADYAERHPLPLVLATTGYSEEQVALVRRLAERMPVVYAANCSLGVTVMARIVAEVSRVLGGEFDIEIIEKHHHKKLDAPSGTAKLLADAADPDGEYARTYGRSGFSKRQKEIGIHAVRGGNITGEHTVLFAGGDEVLEITHRAGSKQIYANGALRAARFVVGQKPGLYAMDDVLFGGETEGVQ